MKAFRGTLILLALAAALGGWIWFNERGPLASSGAKVLWRTDARRVSQIRLAPRDGQTITLQRRGETWFVSPENGAPVPAAAYAVQSLLEAVQLVQSSATAPATPADLKQRGLDAPQSTLSVDGQTIAFGSRPSFDASQIYARAGNDIALLPASLHEFTAKPLDAWRDKTVLRVTASDATRLALQSPAVNAAFVKSDAESTLETSWRVAQPLRARADASAIESFLGQLNATKATAFLDDNPKVLSRWGLDKPLATVRVRGAQGEKTLRVGRKLSGGYAAQNSDSPAVFQIPDSLFALSNRPLREWRDKAVLRFDINALSRVEIAAREQNKVFVKRDNKWQPEPAPKSTLGSDGTATHQAVLDVLIAAQALRARDFLRRENEDGIFNAPLLVLKLNNGTTQTLEIARRNDRLFARVTPDEGATIYELPSGAFDDFRRALDALLSSPQPTPKSTPKPTPRAG